MESFKNEKIQVGEYTVCNDGRVFKNGKEVKYYINSEGYVRCLFKGKTVGVHTLIAKHFNSNDSSSRTYVNHIDSNKENNHFYNLDWVTQSENNIHQILSRVFNKKQKLYLLNKDEPIKIFMNFKEAIDETKISLRSIWLSIKNNEVILNTHYKFVYSKNKLFNKIDNLNISRIGKPIKVKNIFTNEITIFKSITDAAKSFNVKNNHIWYSIRRSPGLPRFLLKCYQVSYIEDDFDKISNIDIKLAANRGEKKVLCYDIKRNSYIFFNSAAEFIREYKISRKIVTVMLLKNKIKIYKDLVFLYFNDDNKQVLINFVNNMRK